MTTQNITFAKISDVHLTHPIESIELKFSEFEFDPRLQEGIEASNYTEATPIQEQVIPLILEGKDIIASAQTGTGKTAAFLLPLVHKILTQKSDPDAITSLIIVPTRELAIQIQHHMEGLSYFTSIGSIAVYGGNDGSAFLQEKKALSSGADMVVCTPGKMLYHIKTGHVKLNKLQYLVLDEADRMLDMGFSDDIMFIIDNLPKTRQTLLFSATMPAKIRALAKTILVDPVEITIAVNKPAEKIKQEAFIVDETQKIPLVLHLLREKKDTKVLIFCSSKISVKQLTQALKRKGINAGEIHSDLEQDAREEIMMHYKSGRLPVLVATDILSRGIDFDDIDLVINFDVPHDSEDYVHRIGRTARAASEGSAYTLVSTKEQGKFHRIEKFLGKEIEKTDVSAIVGPQPEYNPKIHKEKRKFRGKKRHPKK